MTDRQPPDAVHANRIARQSSAFHYARGRVTAADRQLAEVLHPSMAAGLTRDQREKITEARRLLRSVDPALREPAPITGVIDGSNVIPLRRPAPWVSL